MLFIVLSSMDSVFVGLLQPGAIIGGSYRVEALLGRGGMGEVWVARHLRLANKRVAVKVLRAQKEALTGDSLKRFRKEAEIASRLEHPHIVSISDFNLTPSGHPFMVMEFLEGESLGARLQRGPLTLAETRMVLRQICRALDMTHSQGILHRDLKPDNIFLTTKGNELCVKVLDFGISKILGSDSYTQDSVVVGSPRYMSPEQARGQNSQLSPQSDIFSLGAVVYEMLLGKHAFEGNDVVQVLYHVVYDSPKSLKQLLPGLPEGPLNAVETALEKQPQRRHLSATAFSKAFDDDAWVSTAGEGDTRDDKPRPVGPANPPPDTGSTTSSLPPPPRKSRLWLQMLMVGAFSVLVVGGALVVRQSDSSSAATGFFAEAIAAVQALFSGGAPLKTPPEPTTTTPPKPEPKPPTPP
ncbi:MAG: serine/threonine protein kinase, partial [Cystobacterineae bacterium]|nr:serine/threonine protein kinase [Cystobacterineae bacterium]